MIGCLPTQPLAFLADFVFATHATKAIAFEWKPGFSRHFQNTTYNMIIHNKRQDGDELSSLIVEHKMATAGDLG